MKISPVSNFNVFCTQKSFGVHYVEKNKEPQLLELVLTGENQEYMKAFNQLKKEIEEHPQLKDLDAPYSLKLRQSKLQGSYILPSINDIISTKNHATLKQLVKPEARKEMVEEMAETAKHWRLL